MEIEVKVSMLGVREHLDETFKSIDELHLMFLSVV
jgi:hypothetical protein